MPPRSRNFNGCWTCRMRKIKCDLARPTCSRCQKANLECKGYGLVLAWENVVTIDKYGQSFSLVPEGQQDLKKESGIRRRNVDLVKFPRSMLYQTYDELDEVIAHFDDSDPEKVQKFLIIGPFGVYSTNYIQKDPPYIYQKTKTKTKQPRLASSTPGSFTPMSSKKSIEKHDPLPSAVSVTDVLESAFESSIFSKTNNAYVHYELVEFAKLTIVAIKGPRYKFSDQGMFHILYPKFFPNVESDNWRPNSGILSTFFSQDTKTHNLIMAPSMSSNFRFFHESMLSSMRVAHNKNPWVQLVVPFLKQLFFEIVCEEYPESKNWKDHTILKSNTNVSRELLLRNMRFSIFCMCLSISWHERSLSGPIVKNSTETYVMNDELKVSVELRKIAINILNYHLDEYDGNANSAFEDDYDTYFLLALILQVHIDSLFGIFENYELMYAIGDYILKEQKPKTRNMSSLERYLRHTFNILNTFYESTQAINFFNYSISDLDRKSKYQDLSDDYDLTANHQDREQDVTSDDFESDSEIDDAQDKNINVRATSLDSKGLTFTVNFRGDKSERDNDHAPKHAGSLSHERAQENLNDRLRQDNPVTPSLNDGTAFSSNALPRALVRLVQEVVHLTNHKNVFRTRGLAPRNFPRICAEVEDKIMNFNLENHWKLYDNEYNPITNVATKAFISEFHEGLYYHVSCFHNALIVYFKRLISESHIRVCQTYISSSFDHMEKLFSLNKSLHKRGEGLSFNPLFWPLLICGCEIDLKANPQLRAKCQNLWKADCFKRFNHWRSKQILFEVWHRREAEGENISFMDLIREWEIVLSLG